MPGAVGVALAGLAAASWKEMWKLYDQKYGKFGEEAVKRLRADYECLEKFTKGLAQEVVAIDQKLDAMTEVATYRRDQWLAADNRANELAARLNEAMCRLERADLPPNPYDEGEPGVPEPTERTDP